MSGKQHVSVIIPFLTTERFVRANLRRMIRQRPMWVVNSSLKWILRQTLPLSVRQALRSWWVSEAKYPTPKSLSARFVHRAIERNYNLTILGVPALLPGGVANATWLISAKEGRFFVKVYCPNEHSIEAVQEEVDLYEYLIQHDIHAPIVFRTKSGQTVSEAKHVYPMIVMQREELRMVSAYTANEVELLRISQDLAKMHQVLRSYPRKGKLRKHIEDPDFRREDWETYDRLVASPFGNSFTQNELSMVKSVDRKMTEYMRKNYPPEMKEFSVIHGDLALEHAQFLPDGEVYFFDFANNAWAPIARELAVFFVLLYTREGGATTLEKWEKLREFVLEGYQSVNVLSEVDREAIKPMMIRKLNKGTIEFDALEYEKDREAYIQTKKKRYELIEYLLNQT